MFYVYRNTTHQSEVIAEFSDEDMALSFMEHKATREGNPEVTGYAVRDYDLKIKAEYEV
jgi:hypothetical protein